MIILFVLEHVGNIVGDLHLVVHEKVGLMCPKKEHVGKVARLIILPHDRRHVGIIAALLMIDEDVRMFVGEILDDLVENFLMFGPDVQKFDGHVLDEITVIVVRVVLLSRKITRRKANACRRRHGRQR